MALPNAPEPAQTPRIAVIGGGISGLAAAHRLTEILPRAEVVLFEAAGRLGGVLETVHRDGYLVERSADNFLTTRPAAVALCKRLGIEKQLLPTDEARRQAAVVRDGRIVPIPAGFYLMSPRRLGPLLKSPLLTPAGRLRVLAEMLVPPRQAGSRGQRAGNENENHSSLQAPSSRLQAFSDESVASFVRRRLGREAYERLVQPLVAGIYTADAERLSMAATMPQFLAYEREYGSLLRATLFSNDADRSDVTSTSGARYSAFVAPREGLGSLVDAIAKRLPASTVRTGTRVHQIRKLTENQWQLLIDDAPAELFSAIIIALPSYAAADLLAPVDAELAGELAAIEYSGCAVVSCAYRRDQIGTGAENFGFVVPQIEHRRIVAGSFASNKFPDRAPKDHMLIRAFIGGSLQPELVELPDDELRRLATDELGDLLRITGAPQWVDVARWRQSMPQYHVGHLDRVARIEQRAGRWPNFALAGNAYHGVGIPQCIVSGEAAAERVAKCIQLTP